MATQPLGDYTILILNIIAMILIAVMVVYNIVAANKAVKRQKPRLRTRIECLACGYSVEREYRQGDYVGKPEGRCPKCGSEMIVAAVFEERPEERREEQRLISLLERRKSSSLRTRRGA